MKFIIIGKNIDVTPGLRGRRKQVRKVRKVLYSEYRDSRNLKCTERTSEN